MQRYSSESSDSDGNGQLKIIDYSYAKMDTATMFNDLEELFKKDNTSRNKKPDIIQTMLLYSNDLIEIPQNLAFFHNLRHVDLSNNRLEVVPDFLTRIPLATLSLKNNRVTNESLPKSLNNWKTTLRSLHLGGNKFHEFPFQLLELAFLKNLYIGSNKMKDLPKSIHKITRLSVLCLGGNLLTELPDTLGRLESLEVLNASDNNLEFIPRTIANLHNLKTLQLHKNRLRTLPTEIIALRCLRELSLRDNPLVVQFINDMNLNPPSLLEVAARAVKVHKLQYDCNDLPRTVINYLECAHHCLNPNCNGVYFDSRVEHIKFVDFCGKYRVPLMEYLCSSKCINERSPAVKVASSPFNTTGMIKKVLLG